jgi:hypothetical protein
LHDAAFCITLTPLQQDAQQRQERIMKWQIEQYSTGAVLSVNFYETDKCARLIELIAHMTGIDIDDLDAVCVAE